MLPWGGRVLQERPIPESFWDARSFARRWRPDVFACVPTDRFPWADTGVTSRWYFHRCLAPRASADEQNTPSRLFFSLASGVAASPIPDRRSAIGATDSENGSESWKRPGRRSLLCRRQASPERHTAWPVPPTHPPETDFPYR